MATSHYLLRLILVGKGEKILTLRDFQKLQVFKKTLFEQSSRTGCMGTIMTTY